VLPLSDRCFCVSGVLVLPLSAVYQVVDTWIFSRKALTSFYSIQKKNFSI